jgi:hypothetical protein
VKRLWELDGTVIEPCPCHQCLSVPGSIYRIIGTNFRVKYRKTDNSIKFWTACPWDSGDPIVLEDLFDLVDEEVKLRLIYHLNYFK